MAYEILAGNVGTEVEDDPIPDSPTRRVRFSMAVDETDGSTTWARVSLIGRQAEIAEDHLVVGSSVLVVGDAKTRAYLNRAGEPTVGKDVRAFTFRFIGRRPETSTAQTEAAVPDLLA